MKITDVKVRKANKEGTMRGIISITFDDEIVIHDIKLIQGTEKLFVAMPSRKTPEGDHKDIAHPIKQAVREKIQEAVMIAYDEAIKKLDEQE